MKRNHVNDNDVGVKPWAMFKISFWGPYGEMIKFVRASNEAMARVMVKNRNKVWQIHSITVIPDCPTIYRGVHEGVEPVPAADVSEPSNSKLAEMGG